MAVPAARPRSAATAVPLERRDSVDRMRCPVCGGVDDKVVDSRTADDDAAIRRRRQCLACGHRFTTYERLEELPLVVLKRSGDPMPFDRGRIRSGVAASAKGRPVSEEQLEALALAVEDEMRLAGGEVTTEEIGLAVLARLRELDEVAYVRFASVYKGFEDPRDFEREIGLLKATAPKAH